MVVVSGGGMIVEEVGLQLIAGHDVVYLGGTGVRTHQRIKGA